MIEFFMAAAFLVSAMIGLHDDTNELVILLADENGKVGKVAVNPGHEEEVLLEKHLHGATVGSGGSAKFVKVEDEHVSRHFSKALAAHPKAPRSFTLYFQTGTVKLVDGSDKELPKIFEEIGTRAHAEVLIIGHTDSTGATEVNDRLSLKRAESVMEWLSGKGIDRKEMRASGRGERELLIKTPDNTSNRQNRRVEVVVQ